MAKKFLGVLLVSAMALGTTGVYAQEVVKEENKTIDVIEEPQAVISYNETQQVFKNKQEVLMLKTKIKELALEGVYAPAVKDKINRQLKIKKDAFDKTSLQLAKSAEEDYNERTYEQRSYWAGYYYGKEFTAKRLDDQVLSLTIRYDMNTMGAHPNSVITAVNFDGTTGDVLTFKDIVTDEQAAKVAIHQFIVKAVEEEARPEYYFEDYERYVEDILKDYTWYFSEKGLVIICNEYIIAPHARGLIEFTLPYEAFPYLKTEYVKVAASH